MGWLMGFLAWSFVLYTVSQQRLVVARCVVHFRLMQRSAQGREIQISYLACPYQLHRYLDAEPSASVPALALRPSDMLLHRWDSSRATAKAGSLSPETDQPMAWVQSGRESQSLQTGPRASSPWVRTFRYVLFLAPGECLPSEQTMASSEALAPAPEFFSSLLGHQCALPACACQWRPLQRSTGFPCQPIRAWQAAQSPGIVALLRRVSHKN